GPIRTRPPICRCSRPSAIRSPSTPTGTCSGSRASTIGRWCTSSGRYGSGTGSAPRLPRRRRWERRSWSPEGWPLCGGGSGTCPRHPQLLEGSGGSKLLCRDRSECDEDDEEDELLHARDVSPSVASLTEVSAHLVGAPAFKAGGRSDPATAGSIPVHLRFFEGGGGPPPPSPPHPRGALRPRAPRPA